MLAETLSQGRTPSQPPPASRGRRKFVAPARGDVDPNRFEAPIFDGFRHHAAWWLGAHSPSLEVMNAALRGIVHPHSGAALYFVEQTAELLSDGLHYEQRIFERGAIATRADNWHDLFNALIWIEHSSIKAALNARQVADIARFGPAERSRAQCALTTDIIVGFPGETEADFRQTLEVAEAVGYDGAFTFVYSPRRGTEAAALPDQVPHEVKVERVERLVEVIQRRALERSQRFVGRTLEVLVEGPSRTDPSRLRGRSRHNKVVNFTGLGEEGELVAVEITGATSQTLTGEMSLVARGAARD